MVSREDLRLACGTFLGLSALWPRTGGDGRAMLSARQAIYSTSACITHSFRYIYMLIALSNTSVLHTQLSYHARCHTASTVFHGEAALDDASALLPTSTPLLPPHHDGTLYTLQLALFALSASAVLVAAAAAEVGRAKLLDRLGRRLSPGACSVRSHRDLARPPSPRYSIGASQPCHRML